MSNKIVFLGDSSAGKTSIVQRYMNKVFYSYQEPTVGAAFVSFNSKVNNKKVNFQIWDTAGQERYRSLASMYYRGCDFAIIVFDMSIHNSFNSVKSWIRELDSKTPECNKIIVGNKVDLKIAVDQHSITEFINYYKLEYFEVSAKTGENIDELFNYIIRNNNISKKYIDKKEVNDCYVNIEYLGKENRECCIIL